MGTLNPQPTLFEKETILQSAAGCLLCKAPECHEFTPEGVVVCSAMPWWNGRPVTRAMLRDWQETLAAMSSHFNS